MDGDIQEEPLHAVGALPEPSINVDASTRFQEIENGGDFSSMAKRLGADIAEAQRRRDDRDPVPDRGLGEIIERIVTCKRNQVIGWLATILCPATCMAAILGDQHGGSIAPPLKLADERFDKDEPVTPPGARIEYDLDLGQALSRAGRSVAFMLQ
jgi:hypothetical protein